MYTFENLKEDVSKEAEALKVHATKQELKKLDFSKLSPRDYRTCIYGQMTNNCFSARAAKLIFNCCHRYFKAEIEEDESEIAIELASKDGDVCKFVNGEKINGVESVNQLYKTRDDGRNLHYSAIEAYIMLPEAKNANLIAYLKGEVDTLEL